ncbi:MFS transporter [Sporichthya brevicatena]|uniref:MFS transporter n=2 Tax=Sporichthya brevicatena TaxID=171442 RepID=A0ABN1G3A4_9ACTN
MVRAMGSANVTTAVERVLAAPVAVPREVEQRRTLAVAVAGTFLALVVYTVPLGIMPSIAAGLDAGTGTQTWLLAAVSLGMATTLISAGALGDDYGRKRVLIGGAYVLAVASAVCAFAPNPGVYLAGALAQGAGGSAIMACSLGLIAHAFPEGPQRARASGIWGAALGAGIGSGPLLGATFDSTIGWHAAFAFSGVLALVLAVAAGPLLVESKAEEHKPIDLPGMALLGLGVGALIGGLVRGRSGWGDPPTLLLIGGGLVLLALFVLVEIRQRAPMLPMGLFRNPRFQAVTTAAVTTGLGVISLLSYLCTMSQRGMGDEPIVGAALIAVWAAASIATALLVPRHFAAYSGRAHLAGGLVVTGVGMISLYGVDAGTNPWLMVAGLALAGIGSGIANSALGREAVTAVPHGRGSLGSGANNTARYVGSSVGVSIVATIVAAQGDGADAIMDGWNVVVLVTTALTFLGAAAVLACRPRARNGEAK